MRACSAEPPIDYWLVTTGPDSQPWINGAIMWRTRQQATCNTIDVSLVDEFYKILEAGGNILTPKTAIPGVGSFAYCTDAEGNVFGIMHEYTSAR